MTPETLARLRAQLEAEEGRVRHLYLCGAGHVTCGIGHKLESVHEAFALPFYPREEVPADYQRVLEAGPGLGVDAYRRITTARMSDSGIDALLDADVRRFIEGLRSALPWFDGLPEAAQLAVFDMAFNLGLAGFGKYLNLINALRSQDWRRAAAECHRRGISEDRNQRTAALFLQSSTP